MVEEWVLVETLPPLGEDEVQLWRIDLAQINAPQVSAPAESMPLEVFGHLLSFEEQARAERLRAGRVQLQFVVARAVLRTLLGHCLSIGPKEVAITQTSFGKPETPGMFFNVAHSGAAILIALCRGHRVGIDVEYLSREVEALNIAKNSFTPTEYAALASIEDESDRQRAFFRCWTRKEAVIKADGRGLSLPLDSFEVPVGETALQMVISASDRQAMTPYYVGDICYGDEVAAACALSVPHCTAAGFIFPLVLLAQKG